jgi:hypothetical protein
MSAGRVDVEAPPSLSVVPIPIAAAGANGASTVAAIESGDATSNPPVADDETEPAPTVVP